MKILAICGKSASGKSTAAKRLKEILGDRVHIVKSYTTREERINDPEDKNTHIFVNAKFYANHKKDAIAVYDSPSGYHSWVDVSSFREDKINIYVIDPKAVVNELYPWCIKNNWELTTIYIDIPESIRFDRFTARNGNAENFEHEAHLDKSILDNLPNAHIVSNMLATDSVVNYIVNVIKRDNKLFNYTCYLLGDMLKEGSILLRQREAETLRAMGINLYSPIEQKAINDKSAQTVESNNKLAERIVLKDSNAIRLSNLIIGEVDNNNVGSSVEIGQIMEFNWFWDNISEIVKNSDDTNLRENILKFLKTYPRKECYFHTTDIRQTDLPEVGYRRSFSFNQYLVGACLALNPIGILRFSDIIKILGGK